MNSSTNVYTPGPLILTCLRRYNHVLSEDSKLHVWAWHRAHQTHQARYLLKPGDLMFPWIILAVQVRLSCENMAPRLEPVTPLV